MHGKKTPFASVKFGPATAIQRIMISGRCDAVEFRLTEVIWEVRDGNRKVGFRICLPYVSKIVSMLANKRKCWPERSVLGQRWVKLAHREGMTFEKRLTNPVAQIITSTSCNVPSCISTPVSVILLIPPKETSTLSAASASKYPFPGVILWSCQSIADRVSAMDLRTAGSQRRRMV
jgi:hypothetical protein